MTDAETGVVVDDSVHGAGPDAVFSADSTALLHTRLDDLGRRAEVRRHVPDAGGLVIATDQTAARAYAAILREITGESVQLYRREGDHRVCVAAAERPVGLRDSIPVGATLSMQAGSAAQVLLAWEEPDRLHRGLQEAAFTATMLSAVRRRGWAQSVGEREAGVASVSAPVRSPSGRVIAAVSISGPIERLSRQPGRLHAATVIAGANKLTEVLEKHAKAAEAADRDTE